jgi:hypothetical protein
MYIGTWEVIVRYGRCGGCGKGIVRYKWRFVNWKYVRVRVGRLKLDMAYVLWVFKGYWDVNLQFLIGNKKSGIWEIIIKYGRCGVSGHVKIRGEWKITNWK